VDVAVWGVTLTVQAFALLKKGSRPVSSVSILAT
jgi:hypothetical protein